MKDEVRNIGNKTEEGRLKITKIENYEKQYKKYSFKAIAQGLLSGIFIAATAIVASNVNVKNLKDAILVLFVGMGAAVSGLDAVESTSRRSILEDKINTLEEEILEEGKGSVK